MHMFNTRIFTSRVVIGTMMDGYPVILETHGDSDPELYVCTSLYVEEPLDQVVLINNNGQYSCTVKYHGSEYDVNLFSWNRKHTGVYPLLMRYMSNNVSCPVNEAVLLDILSDV